MSDRVWPVIGAELRTSLSFQLAQHIQTETKGMSVKFDGIVAVARGGLDVAMCVADKLMIRDIGIVTRGPETGADYKYAGSNPRGSHGKYLVVSFAEYSGNTARQVKQLLPNSIFASVVKFRDSILHPNDTPEISSDIVWGMSKEFIPHLMDRPTVGTADGTTRAQFVSAEAFMIGPFFSASSKWHHR